MKKLLLVFSIVLVYSCSPKQTDLIWQDQYGNPVPIIMTEKNDTTYYDFGAIILYPDTTYGGDTIK